MRKKFLFLKEENTVKTSTRVLSIILAVVMVVGIVPIMAFNVGAAYNNTNLKFDENGEFVLLQVSDIQDDEEVDERSLAIISKAVARFNPDMAVLTGDNVTTKMTESKFKQSADQFLAPMLNAGLKVAVTFGNHDSEGNTLNPAYSRQNQYNYYVQKGCIDYDENSLSHVGTGSIPIYSNDGSRVAFCVFPMDTGDYDSNGKYDHVEADQNAWFESESARLKTLNNGNNVPTLVFQHIPVPEIYPIQNVSGKDDQAYPVAQPLLQASSSGVSGAIQGTGRWENSYYILNPNVTFTDSTGVYGEGPCPSDVNGGQYASWMRTGNVVGAFFGHDHKNSFVGVDSNGITMGYCKAATLNSYNDGNPGVRIFRIHEDGTYTTQSVTEADVNIEDRPEYNHDEIGGTPTVPNIVYVGAANNSAAQQAVGNVIQTKTLNYKTLAQYENDLDVTIDLSADCSNVSLTATYGVNLSSPTVSNNSDGTKHYKWTITGGTAVEGTAIEYVIHYNYSGYDFEQRAYSYVEGIKTPAGHFSWVRNWTGSEKSSNYISHRSVYTVTGTNVFGRARSQTDDEMSGASASDAASGYYNFGLEDGFVRGTQYAINMIDPPRKKDFEHWTRFTAAGKSPQATVYVDSSVANNLGDVDVSLNFYRNAAQDNGVSSSITTVFKSGDVGYSTSNWNTGTVSTSTISAGSALTLAANKGSLMSRTLTGTLPADGATYTMITRMASTTTVNGANSYFYAPVLLKFVTYNKADLRALVNAERVENRQAFSYGSVQYNNYLNAFKEAYKQLNQINTTQSTIDAAVTRLNNAIEGLTSTVEEISDNGAARLGASAPDKVFVAAQNFGLAQQPDGNYIQPNVINYTNNTLVPYTAFTVSLPDGATTPECTVTRVRYNSDGTVASETTLDRQWDSSTRTCSLVASDRNQANPGDVIKYAFSYRINGKNYVQYEASYVAKMPTASGWLTYIRRKNFWGNNTSCQQSTLFIAPAGIVPEGVSFEALTGNSGADNRNCSVNLTSFAGTGVQESAAGVGIRIWTGPERKNEENWYAGNTGGSGSHTFYHADFNIQADSSVVSKAADLGVIYRATALTDADDCGDYTQEFNHFQTGDVSYYDTGDDPDSSNWAFYRNGSIIDESHSTDFSKNQGTTMIATLGNRSSNTLPATSKYGFYVRMKSKANGQQLTTKYSWQFNFSTVDKTALRNAVATEDNYFRNLSDGYDDSHGKFTNYVNALVYAKAMTGNLNLNAAADADVVGVLDAAVAALEYLPADYTAVKAKVDQVMKVKVGDQLYSYYEWKPLVDAGQIDEATSVRCYRPFETNDPTYYATGEYYPIDYYRSTNEVDIPINNIDWNLDIRYQSTVDAQVNLVHVGWESVYLNNADYSGVDFYLDYQDEKDGVATIRLPDDYGAQLPEYARHYLPYTYYTTESYQAWDAAYTAGSTIRTYMSPEQGLVDQMATNLANAYNGLVLKSADYTELNALVADVNQNTSATVTVVDPSNAANNYTIPYYDPAYIAAINAKLDLIPEGLYIVNQADIDQVTGEIDDMYVEMGNHLNTADYTFANAQKAIEATYEAEYEKYYTAESWAALTTARNAIRKGKMSGEQDTVNAYAKAIYDARNALAYNPADYSVVNQYLNMIAALDSNNYTNWNTVQAAVDAVDTTKDVTQQAEVDAMAQALIDAYNGRTLKDADYTELNAQITAAQAIVANEALYTTGSFSNLTEKLAAANNVKNRTPLYTILEQAAVDTAASNLAAAIAGMKYKDATIDPLEEAILNYMSVDEFSYKDEYGDNVWTEVEGKYNDAAALKAQYDNNQLDIRDNQTIIDTANALNAAVANLPALYTNVTYAKAEIPTDLTVYTDASVAALNRVLNSINYNLKIGDQETVDAYADAIYEAIANLELKGADLTALINAITAADARIDGIDTTWFTADSWSAFETAYNAAVDIRDADPAYDIDSQADVDAAAADLVTATAGLAYIGADYTALNTLVAAYEALDLNAYTPASVTASDVVAKYNAAKAVDANLTIDQQATIDAAASALETALNALVAKADKAALAAAITTAQGKVEADYTPESWLEADLANAIAAATAVYDDDNAAQTAVDEQVTALETAIGKLVLRPTNVELVAKEGSDTVVDNTNKFIYGLPVGAGMTDILDVTELEGEGRVQVIFYGNNTCIGTGTVINVYKGEETTPFETYTVVIFGDNDGDGDITSVDVNDFLLFDAWMDSTFDYTDLAVANVFALDLNHDGEVNALDIADVLLYDAWMIDDIPQTINLI